MGNASKEKEALESNIGVKKLLCFLTKEVGLENENGLHFDGERAESLSNVQTGVILHTLILNISSLSAFWYISGEMIS
jgi:hypothetical protein